MISTPLPISQGFEALARQWLSVGMKHVFQPACENVDTSESLLAVADMVTSSFLEDRTEGSQCLTLSGMRSLAVFLEDPKWVLGLLAAVPVVVAGFFPELRLGFVRNLLEAGSSSSQLESSMN